MYVRKICLIGLICLFGLFKISESSEIVRLQLNSESYIRFDLDSEYNGIRLIKIQGELQEDVSIIGRNLGIPRIERGENGLYLKYETAELGIDKEEVPGGYILKFYWTTDVDDKIEDCNLLGDDQWYGGPQLRQQYWPIQKLTLVDFPYVTTEKDSAAVLEPYWLSSSGKFVYVYKETPLFIDQNNLIPTTVCFISEIKSPYSSQRNINALSYVIGYLNSSRTAHEHVVKNYFGKPSGRPDYRMIEQPIWSTWAEFKRDVNETAVTDFANNILKYKFNNSQLEIDDFWETCYGSFNVDTKRFPDLKSFSRKLKSLGFRVTIWIHPFINEDCDPWYTEAKTKGYFVKNETGGIETQWWNSQFGKAGYIDFTNPEAADWWVGRLKNLQTTYEIDSFKFDAGESSWSPQIPVQNGSIDEHPSHISIDYVRVCAQFGSMIEVRTAQRTQDLPVFVRMLDKDTVWGFENGLSTLITTLMQMNINGYPFVLPDMIGGNGYTGRPSKELFIRWIQANTFMPSMQYSYVPWDYDNETVEISQVYTELHAEYSPYISKLFDEAVATGAPVNMPIWWIDPFDEEAVKIWDEYLLGEDILVAPVVEKGATSRDIYLPKGKWMAEGNASNIVEGPQWLKKYSAPLKTLPYFVRSPK